MDAGAHEADGREPERRRFGHLLRLLRRDAGLTQEELARRAGVNNRTISNLERGVFATPRADSALLIADALGLRGRRRSDFFACIDRERPARALAGLPAGGAPGPPAAGPLLGREDALAAARALLADRACRVVTLVGPGGVGKTRLAIEVAREAAAAGRPAHWAALESLGSADEVLPAIARAVGAAPAPDADPASRIAAAVTGRGALLAVDNCEHVIEAAAGLAGLLAAVPDLQVLATSREALRISGERVLPVVPLPVPDAAEDAARAAASPAVRLFVERSGVAEPEDLAAVRRIVALLDGLPLAIELAAAQRRALSAATIAGLLDSAGLSVLEGGRRDAHARLRSMDAAIRWSVDLLDAPARRLLRLLAVFRGGCDAAALLDACEAAGDPALAGGLVALTRASLVEERRQDGGPPRIVLLSPVRMFAAGELERSGERGAAEAAHRVVMRGLARRARDLAASPGALLGLAAFDRERDNLLAALERAVRDGDGADAIELAAAMAWWWENRSEPVEGLRWLESALAAPGADTRPDDAVSASAVAFIFAYFLGRHDRCAVHAAEMERIARAAGRDDLLGAARVVAGDLAWGVHGDVGTAASRYDDGLALLEPLGPTTWLGQACTRAADAATERGDATTALGHIERAIAIRNALGEVVFLPTALLIRGGALAALGRNAGAREAFLSSVEEAVGLGQPLFTAHGLVRLACLDAVHGDAARRRRSARLLGAALGLMEVRQIALDPTQEPFVAEALSALDAELGAAEVEALLAAGRSLAIADAAALARGGAPSGRS